MLMSATFGAHGVYRYTLTRDWRKEEPGKFGTVVFCMLNPSTADAEKDDPTIRRCIGFAKRWGYGSLVVVNLYALRTPSPKVLLAKRKGGADVLGPDNLTHIRAAVLGIKQLSVAQKCNVICAWGANAEELWASELTVRLRGMGADLGCLGRTKSGAPRHPLYVRADQAIEGYDA